MQKGKTGPVKMINNFDTISMDELHQNCNRAIYKSVEFNPEAKRRKIYFAGPWFDEKASTLYDACQIIEQSVNTRYDFFYPRNQVNETPEDAFKTNVKYIRECDILIALVSRKDVGTAWEIGMAYAMNKPVYLLGYDATTFLSHTNVMLAFTGKCIILDKYAKFLTVGLSDDEFVNIENKWEGIE